VDTLTHYFDVGVSILLAVLNAILCGVFVYAWSRLRRHFFVILAVASGLFVYANLFAGYVAVWPLTAESFAAPAMHAFYRIYTVVGPSSSVLWFTGNILFVRAALKSWTSSAQT
jgi:hypothetical protein